MLKWPGPSRIHAHDYGVSASLRFSWSRMWWTAVLVQERNEHSDFELLTLLWSSHTAIQLWLDGMQIG